MCGASWCKFGCNGSVIFSDSSTLNTPMCLEDTEGHDEQDKMLISVVDCENNNLLDSGINLRDTMSTSNMTHLDYVAGPRICQSDIQGCEPYKDLLYPVGSSDMLSIPCSQSFPCTAPLPLSCPNDGVTYGNNDIGNNGTQNPAFHSFSYDGFMYDNYSVVSPGNGCDSFHPSGENCEEKIDSTPTPVEILFSGPDVFGPFSSPHEKQGTEKDQNLGSLFYEPPRFPSIEIPFVSCDLISCSDLQQAYSPLGIRQLMMSSMSCSTPYKLWDSPSSDDSPAAVLKNAAKSFLCTPSIMKKKQHELLSPLQNQRSDKESGNGINHELRVPSMNRDENSHIDALHVEDGSCRPDFHLFRALSFHPWYHQKNNSGTSANEKENMVSVKGINEHVSGTSSSDKIYDWNNCENKKEPEGCSCDATKDIDDDTRSENVGILAEHNVNDIQLFSSRDESIDIFVNTPGTKRGIESPSAWKSPWFMSTLIPGTRIDPDVPFENFGYFMSPGDRSLDAIGLMKFLSVPTAAAFAEAHEVLAGEHLQMPATNGHEESSNVDNLSSNKEQEISIPFLPEISTERRVLDFGGCGIPARGPEKKITSRLGAAASLSSPSSYLLKGCR